MTTKVTPVQLLRSEVLNKRPDPAKLLPGQGAVNTHADQPGLFFADQTGTTLFKVGPCTVGTDAPNTGATGDSGQLGNTKGELWLDTSVTPPLLKVWNGGVWVACFTQAPPTIKQLGVTPVFDGVSNTYTLVEFGTTTIYTPGPSENISVYLGGVPQAPTISYSITGNQITFTDTPLVGSTFHAITVVTGAYL